MFLKTNIRTIRVKNILLKVSYTVCNLLNYFKQLQNGQDRPDPNLTRQIEKLLAEKSDLQIKLQQVSVHSWINNIEIVI